jgi:rubredoxin
MDRPPLREGRVMGRVWMAALGEEALYEVDLPGCCRRSVSAARSAESLDDYFECPACGAAWQAPIAVEPEECAFTERASDGERKGAA